MLRAPEGEIIEEITFAIGWQSHTVRVTMARTLKNKRGLTIISEKVEGRGAPRLYSRCLKNSSDEA